MKILFVGLGSIGQRHLRNVKTILETEDVSLSACRKTFSQLIIEDGVAKNVENTAVYYGVQEYRDLQIALAQQPDVTFICNPSSLHLKTALSAAEAGSHLFIEKPLATELAGLDRLERLVHKHKLTTMVGFQTRFHPLIQDVKALLKNRVYGDVLSARFNWSTYLPSHHPYEDYRNGYAARRDLGGGVTFCLIHELDLIQHFFGLPQKIYAVRGTSKYLEMDAEDTVSALFDFPMQGRSFPVSLHLSFAQGLEKRKFEVLMEKALLECDLQSHALKITDHQQNVVVDKEIPGLERNEPFLGELRHFFDCMRKGVETDIPIDDGRNSVEIAIGIQESIRLGRTVALNSDSHVHDTDTS